MASRRIFYHSGAKILIIAFAMAFSVTSFSPPAVAAERNVYLTVESFTWREFIDGQRAVMESGPRVGVGFSYYNVKNNIAVKPSAEIFGGSVDYKGQACSIDPVTLVQTCVPATTTVNYLGFKVLGDVGRQFKSAQDFVEPFVGVDFRFWRRDIKNGTTASGAPTVGYTENWMVLQGRLGLRGGIALADKKQLFAEIGAHLPMFNENTAYLSDIGGPDVTLHPGRQASYFAEAGIKISSFKGSLFYDSLRFPQSETVFKDSTFIEQPESRMDVYGVKLGVVF